MVLSAEESSALFGAFVAETGVQPVWIRIRNNDSVHYWLFSVSVDPQYYSPHEAAWKNHFTFGGYSNVKMEHLKKIMSLSNTEVLLFIPIFHAYRFSNKDFGKEHKTRMFIEEFTSTGVKDYGNVNNYLFSVREKLLKDIKLKYVRPLLLDGGATKNALI